MQAVHHKDSKGKQTKAQPAQARPRRAVEADYMAALGDRITLDDWRAIVGKAVEDAKGGDAQARAWVASCVLGKGAPAISLTDLARREVQGITPDEELAAMIEYDGMDNMARLVNGAESPLDLIERRKIGR